MLPFAPATNVTLFVLIAKFAVTVAAESWPPVRVTVAAVGEVAFAIVAVPEVTVQLTK